MKKKYRSACIRGKLKVYRYLIETSQLRKYLPYTCSFTENNLQKALSKYSTLYIKPDYGAQGKGIYKVITKKSGFLLKNTKQSRVFNNASSLYIYLKKHSPKKLIIQKGINIEKIQGNPYDIRAMIQRKPKGEWVLTGIFAKVGAPNKIVNNYSQGGKLSTMKKLYSLKGLSYNKQKQRLHDMEKLALVTAKSLSTKKSGMHQLGIDLAYDQLGNLWILEVNSYWPQFSPLKKLDPKMYIRMLSLARSYGRYS